MIFSTSMMCGKQCKEAENESCSRAFRFSVGLFA